MGLYLLISLSCRLAGLLALVQGARLLRSLQELLCNLGLLVECMSFGLNRLGILLVRPFNWSLYWSEGRIWWISGVWNWDLDY